mmetsp:Transcript_39545/g.114128  ORF Transcript_39545/g.114128 Transcript_39545/m.114128 type:complete len:260 (+) Transcript_39545:399-1178(+)
MLLGFPSTLKAEELGSSDVSPILVPRSKLLVSANLEVSPLPEIGIPGTFLTGTKHRSLLIAASLACPLDITPRSGIQLVSPWRKLNDVCDGVLTGGKPRSCATSASAARVSMLPGKSRLNTSDDNADDLLGVIGGNVVARSELDTDIEQLQSGLRNGLPLCRPGGGVLVGVHAGCTRQASGEVPQEIGPRSKLQLVSPFLTGLPHSSALYRFGDDLDPAGLVVASIAPAPWRLPEDAVLSHLRGVLPSLCMGPLAMGTR